MASATSPITGYGCCCTAASGGRLTGLQDCEAAIHAWRRRATKVLRRMLLAPRMIGKREYEGAFIDIEYMPPILPEELWRRVRGKLLEDRPKRGRRESRELANIALCGICDLPLASQVDKRGPVYLCKKCVSQPGACGGICILVSNLDARVDEEVVGFLNDKQRAQALLN